MTRQAAIAQLRDTLASLYSDLTSAQRIADDSGLNSSNIAFSSRATDNWHAILAEAEKVGKTGEIIAVAVKDYGASQKLQTAITDLRASATQSPKNNSAIDSRPLIEIPKCGLYGLNILHDEIVGATTTQRYSVKAIIRDETILRVTLKSISHSHPLWGKTTNLDGWHFIKQAQSLVLEGAVKGDMEFFFRLPGEVLIEYYHNDSFIKQKSVIIVE